MMAQKTNNSEGTIQTHDTTWIIAGLAAILTVLWKKDNFTLWHSMVGITILLIMNAVAGKSEFSKSTLLASCAVGALCWILVLGVVIQSAIELIGMTGGIKISDNFGIYHAHIAYFAIWLAIGTIVYFYNRKKLRQR